MTDLWPDAINLDELTPEKNRELEATYGDLFIHQAHQVKQCAEGLIFTEPATLEDGQPSTADQTTEWRCELERCHPDWHVDGENRWKTY